MPLARRGEIWLVDLGMVKVVRHFITLTLRLHRRNDVSRS